MVPAHSNCVNAGILSDSCTIETFVPSNSCRTTVRSAHSEIRLKAVGGSTNVRSSAVVLAATVSGPLYLGMAADSVRAWLDAGTVGCFGAAFGRHLGHGTPVPQSADHPGNYRRSDPRRVPGIPLVPTGLRDPFEAFRIRPSTRAPLRNRTVDLLLTMETLCRLS
jgi:hypothetical protein